MLLYALLASVSVSITDAFVHNVGLCVSEYN